MDLPTDWTRPLREFTAPAGTALVFYEVHGHFGSPPQEASLEKYRMDRQAGTDIRVSSVTGALDERRSGPAWAWFASEQPARSAEVAAAPDAITVRGELFEPPTLIYLRHAIGAVQLLLDHGGLAVHDLQCLRWYTADEWREQLFRPIFQPHDHVVILTSPEAGDRGGTWFHTRGMRKFGRPDVSARHVPDALHAPVTSLVNRLVAMQAVGGHIPEGQPITMRDLPRGPVCRHGGDLDDPDFNNVHVAIDFA